VAIADVLDKVRVFVNFLAAFGNAPAKIAAVALNQVQASFSREQVESARVEAQDAANAGAPRVAALSERFNRAAILAESNSIGQPNIEALQDMGLYVQGFQTTNATKAEIIQSLELSFERADIQILNDELLINELIAYQSERLPSGLVRYGAPEGMHDDAVIALALAWWQAVGANTWLIS